MAQGRHNITRSQPSDWEHPSDPACPRYRLDRLHNHFNFTSTRVDAYVSELFASINITIAINIVIAVVSIHDNNGHNHGHDNRQPPPQHQH
ncbi:hypothetical protein F5Y03DRAFT_392048 [Xylaria venustula]|nr:hypothetical protein F5Y03DRAFT_392048 [Xylaria venustula]